MIYVKTTSLGENNICVDGAKALAKTLAEQSQLTKLSINDNNIGPEGAIALASAIKKHTLITELYIRNSIYY